MIKERFKNNGKFFLLSVALLCLTCAGCSTKNEFSECTSGPIVELRAVIPAGTVNLSESGIFQKSAHEKIITSFGVFVEPNTVLTVSHALPIRSEISGYEPLQRNTESELLTLSSQRCGRPLPLSFQDVAPGEVLYDCVKKVPLGNVTKIKTTAFSKSNVSLKTLSLSNLIEVSGSFNQGDSGLPFCTANGDIAGVLVSVNDSSGFIIASEQIQEFLN